MCTLLCRVIQQDATGLPLVAFALPVRRNLDNEGYNSVIINMTMIVPKDIFYFIFLYSSYILGDWLCNGLGFKNWVQK